MSHVNPRFHWNQISFTRVIVDRRKNNWSLNIFVFPQQTWFRFVVFFSTIIGLKQLKPFIKGFKNLPLGRRFSLYEKRKLIRNLYNPFPIWPSKFSIKICDTDKEKEQRKQGFLAFSDQWNPKKCSIMESDYMDSHSFWFHQTLLKQDLKNHWLTAKYHFSKVIFLFAK